jgi:serine/threonine-protein kinase RsbW
MSFSDCQEIAALARKVQATLIPKTIPVFEGLEINTLFLPCDAIGGEFYDILKISEDILAVLVFDVTGFGVRSTLIAAMAKISFQNHLRQALTPRVVIERVNAEVINELNLDFHITAFLGYIDLHDNKLTYCNAGYSPPLIYRKNFHLINSLETENTNLGVSADAFFEEHSLYLNSGDCLLMFTDSFSRLLSDHIEESRPLFEENILKGLSAQTSEMYLYDIKRRYHEKYGNKGADDDITALAIEVVSQSRKELVKQELGFNSDDPVYFQYVNYYEEMDPVVSVILSAMDSFGYTDDSIRKMKIVMTELLVNAIHHGNKLVFSKKVTMGHLIDKNRAVISIMDQGSGFNPDSIPDPTIPENLSKDSGRGLFIVRHYVDAISFNKKGNRVTVTKYHK